MGLVDHALQYLTLKVILVFGAIAWGLWVAVKRFDETMRLRRLAPGTRGQSLNARFPGGEFLMLSAM